MQITLVVLASLAILAQGFRTMSPSGMVTRRYRLFDASTEVDASVKVEASTEVTAPEAEDQTVQDLDLEQMFEVFEKADKTVTGPSTYTSKFVPKEQAGVSSPLGFFDPSNLSLDLTEREFTVYQEAEVKHGRVAMLAFLGLAVAEVFHPLFGGSIEGPAIYHFQQCQEQMPLFPVWMSWAIAMVEGQTILSAWQPPKETFRASSGIAKMKEGHIAGDIGFDPLGLKPKNDAAFKTMRTKEINNGRLAMLGVAGFVAQELVTGTAIF